MKDGERSAGRGNGDVTCNVLNPGDNITDGVRKEKSRIGEGEKRARSLQLL